uniref:Uncharacterized protein n=1 Tax=Cacopsylla melanoneura TaxID=428564 RepID=A0A8D8VCS6_9HEMI
MKFIMKQSINDLCRLCSKTTESIQHLSSGCSYLAPREYTTRHNLVCGIIHQAIYNSLFSKPSSVPYYQYKPQKIIENDKAKIYWDVSVISDTNIPHNRPDIVVFRKKEKTALIIDVTPLDDNNVPTKNCPNTTNGLVFKWIDSLQLLSKPEIKLCKIEHMNIL